MVRSQCLFFLKSGWIVFDILAQSHRIMPSKNAALQVNPCLVKEQALISPGSFLLLLMYAVWTDNSKFEHDNDQNIFRESIEVWNKVHGLAYAYMKTSAFGFKFEGWVPSFQTFWSFHCQTTSNHNVIQQWSLNFALAAVPSFEVCMEMYRDSATVLLHNANLQTAYHYCLYVQNQLQTYTF